jgi:hypothetical protein
LLISNVDNGDTRANSISRKRCDGKAFDKQIGNIPMKSSVRNITNPVIYERVETDNMKAAMELAARQLSVNACHDLTPRKAPEKGMPLRGSDKFEAAAIAPDNNNSPSKASIGSAPL